MNVKTFQRQSHKKPKKTQKNRFAEGKIIKNMYYETMDSQVRGLLFKNFNDFLARWDTFVLTSHREPDADATGSEYGMYHALRQLGKKAVILNSDRPESKFTYFQTEEVFFTVDDSSKIPQNDFAVIVLDTGDVDHIGIAYEVLFPKAKEVFFIDHHNIGKAKERYQALVDPNRAATSEIIYEFYQECGLEITTDVAFGLFTGLVFDTGSFIYPKTSTQTFAIAQKLMELGVKPKEVHTQLYEQLTPERLKLLAEVQANMKLILEDKIAVQTVTQDILRRTGASLADSDNMINYPLKCKSVVVSIFFKELSSNSVKVSLRSKSNYDVGAFAQTWGGGGHSNAAGFEINDGLEQLKPKVLSKLCEFVQQVS